MAIIKDGNTYTVRCWYKTWKGERKQKVKRGFEKLKDAKKWEREFLSTEHAESLKMNKLIQLFINDMETLRTMGKLRESTVENKKKYINTYIKNYFGQAETSNITPAIINSWIAYITVNFGRGERLSSGTIKIIRNMLSQIFDYGIKHHGLKNNPVKLSDLPEPYTTDERAKFWELDDYQKFYNDLDTENHKALFNTLYWAGLRIGELLALTPADIRDNYITVNKTWVYIKKLKQYAFLPKTKNSIREILVPKFLTDQLLAYIDTIEGIKRTDRIFPCERSTPASLMAYKIKKLGLPKASPHTMRHSYVTNILAEAHDVTIAAAQAGDTPLTIFKHYAHSRKDKLQEAVKSLEQLHQK